MGAVPVASHVDLQENGPSGTHSATLSAAAADRTPALVPFPVPRFLEAEATRDLSATYFARQAAAAAPSRRTRDSRATAFFLAAAVARNRGSCATAFCLTTAARNRGSCATAFYLTTAARTSRDFLCATAFFLYAADDRRSRGGSFCSFYWPTSAERDTSKVTCLLKLKVRLRLNSWPIISHSKKQTSLF